MLKQLATRVRTPPHVCSLGRHAELCTCLVLFFGERAEEIDFVLTGRLPLVAGLERVFEVLLDVDVEGLWLELGVGWVVDTWDGLGRR